MAVTDEYLTYALDQLECVGHVQAKRMFGGAGIYCEGVMFALIADDVLYFKVDDSNRAHFEEAGMEPFHPFPDKATSMSYYEVPGDVLENKQALGQWAQKALRVATKLQSRVSPLFWA